MVRGGRREILALDRNKSARVKGDRADFLARLGRARWERVLARVEYAALPGASRDHHWGLGTT